MKKAVHVTPCIWKLKRTNVDPSGQQKFWDSMAPTVPHHRHRLEHFCRCAVSRPMPLSSPLLLLPLPSFVLSSSPATAKRSGGAFKPGHQTTCAAFWASIKSFGENNFSKVHEIIVSVHETQTFWWRNCKTKVDFYGCLAPTHIMFLMVLEPRSTHGVGAGVPHTK